MAGGMAKVTNIQLTVRSFTVAGGTRLPPRLQSKSMMLYSDRLLATHAFAAASLKTGVGAVVANEFYLTESGAVSLAGLIERAKSR